MIAPSYSAEIPSRVSVAVTDRPPHPDTAAPRAPLAATIRARGGGGMIAGDNARGGRRVRSSGGEANPDELDPAAQRLTGIVKFFNSTKGFGFIIPDFPITSATDCLPHLVGDESAECEVFVHHTAIVAAQHRFRSLAEGECVEFNLVQGPKGYYSQNVTGPQGAPVRGDPKAFAVPRKPVQGSGFGTVPRGSRFSPEKGGLLTSPPPSSQQLTQVALASPAATASPPTPYQAMPHPMYYNGMYYIPISVPSTPTAEPNGPIVMMPPTPASPATSLHESVPQAVSSPEAYLHHYPQSPIGEHHHHHQQHAVYSSSPYQVYSHLPLGYFGATPTATAAHMPAFMSSAPAAHVPYALSPPLSPHELGGGGGVGMTPHPAQQQQHPQQQPIYFQPVTPGSVLTAVPGGAVGGWDPAVINAMAHNFSAVSLHHVHPHYQPHVQYPQQQPSSTTIHLRKPPGVLSSMSRDSGIQESESLSSFVDAALDDDQDPATDAGCLAIDE
ncbi:hypothetical protein BC828DRAFT_224065 [Blastocladiella britannica]|nr:hypothetical protein BC828DRAFT_224065 [Blastocladiella britannica]